MKRDIKEHKKKLLQQKLKQKNENKNQSDSILFGRKKELNLLEGYLENTVIFSNLVAVHGVRRSGKTKLVNYFIERSVKRVGGIVFNFVGDYEKMLLKT